MFIVQKQKRFSYSQSISEIVDHLSLKSEEHSKGQLLKVITFEYQNASVKYSLNEAHSEIIGTCAKLILKNNFKMAQAMQGYRSWNFFYPRIH